MFSGMLGLFVPPKSSDYERAQKAKLLHITLIVVLAASLVIAFINLAEDAPGLATSLFALAGFCIVGLYLNRRMHLRAAGFLLAGLSFLVIGYDLIDGAGLHDPGVAAYPILILGSSFFFGRRVIPFVSLASVASVAIIYVLGINGLTNSIYQPTLNRVLILSVLYGTTGWLTWGIKYIWDETLAQLVQSYELTMEAWARALEYRDGETEGHSRRVTLLCEQLARRLGCTDEQIVHIRRGAYVHDIGKMAIPDRILFKPGTLDDEERELMKQHPTMAYNIICKIPFLQPALAIPYSHHENWDGTGYPQGLKGEGIPFMARIFTVVDHWDAMNSDRPYRKALPDAEIRNYLRENAGKIYDPQVVTEFLALLEEADPDTD